MNMPKYGINKATPADWDRVRKAHPAIEKTTVLDGAPLDDAVNSPKHYGFGKIECIVAIQESMPPEAFKGYLKGNCMKYLWRYDYKGKRSEDLNKALWYLSRLSAEVNADSNS